MNIKLNTVSRRIHTKQRIESVLTNLHNDIYICYLYLVITYHSLHVCGRQTLLCTRLAACYVPLVLYTVCECLIGASPTVVIIMVILCTQGITPIVSRSQTLTLKVGESLVTLAY